PAFRARVPRARGTAAHVRRRRRGREAPDGGVHERRAGEDAAIPPPRTGDVRARRRQGNVEAMRGTRKAELGARNSRSGVAAQRVCSAFRLPRSAFAGLAVLAFAAAPVRSPAQQWPVHSMDRPRPPVVDPGPERPPLAPPSDAIVLFDGKSLALWQSEDSTPAKWVVRDGYLEVAP